MSDLDSYTPGTAIRIDVEVKDYNGDYMDPDTSLAITVIDSAGTKKVLTSAS